MRKQILISLLLFLISCKKENIEGVKIGKNLLENQSFAENKKLDTIIRTTLKGDYNSLRRLNHFPCGGGAGCYDKGFIITQIIYKIGENNFNKMVENLDRKELYNIEDYIKSGLEYGDNNKDGKMDNKIAEKEFPMLMKKLSEK
jgi:hypothetical protein